eukprot:TRINITY_DN26027_c0_g1_i4.p1 TRINITY_DN26027_c0_g1~~TRINITY_DN26027_c0_g1_i4.p1  ORF type:complete len:425 (-),score=55.52 TRINITY_DN26027_c0_g1_i4:19-1293(-)
MPALREAPIGYDELKALIQSTRVDAEEFKAYKSCLQALHSIVQLLGPNWQVRPFGSSANGFGMRGSDLDVTIYLSGIGEQDRPFAIQELQNRLVPILEGYAQFELQEAVWSARVPVLKFKFDGWLDVDFSCQNTEAILNTELLKSYAKIHPVIRQLVVGVKFWAKAQGVCGAKNKHLSSYTLTLMTMYFLQVQPDIQLPCIPTTEFNIDRPMPSFDFSNWTCAFSAPDLLARFFVFYAYDFQWGAEVVSVRLGYRAQMGSPELSMLLGQSSSWRLHVEDPFLLHRNLNCVLGADQENELKNSISSACWDMSSGQIPQALRGQLALSALIGKSKQRPASQDHQHQKAQLYETPSQLSQQQRGNGRSDRAQVAAAPVISPTRSGVQALQKALKAAGDEGMVQESRLSRLAPDPSNVPIPKIAAFFF